MFGSYIVARHISKELGSALTGRDVLCPDGKYHKCHTVHFDARQSLDSIRAELTTADTYLVDFFGPFSDSN